MKKNFLLIFFILLNSFLFAQIFNGGLKLGINGSQVDGDSYAGYNKIGFNAGAFVNTKLKERLKLQFEMIYTQKGAYKPSKPEIGDYFTSKLRLNYVEIPILLLYKYKDYMEFEGGFSAAVLMNQEFQDTYGKIPLTDIYQYNKYDFGFVAGLNFNISEHFKAGMRYTYTLFFTPIRKYKSKSNFFTEMGQTNNVLSLSIYYTF